MAQIISILITVSLVVLRLSLYSLRTPWWYSDYPFTHHSLSGSPQTITILITIYLVFQTISILITVSLVVLRLSLYSSQSPLWYSGYPYIHHSLSGGTHTNSLLTTVSLLVGHQSIPIHITFCLMILRLSLYSSQSPRWYSDYPFTHNSLPGCTQSVPLLIIVSLVVLRLSLHTSPSF